MTLEIGLKDGDFVEIKLLDWQIPLAKKAIAKAEVEKKAKEIGWHALFEKEA